MDAALERLMREERSVAHIVAAQAQRCAERPFLSNGDRTLSYGQLWDGSARVGRGLREAGLEKGDRLAIYLGNCPEFLLALYGLFAIGGVEVPVNTGYRGDLLGYVLQQSGARGLIVGAEHVEKLAELPAGTPALSRIWVVGPVPASSTLALRPFAELLAGPPLAAPADVRDRDLAAIAYTSGTTGPSKGVLLAHRFMTALAGSWGYHVRMTADDVYYTCLPYFHLNGQMASTLTALLWGAQVALDDRFSATTFWLRIAASRATLFNLLGAMCHMLYKQEPSTAERAHRARLCVAAPAPREIYHEFQARFGVRLLEAYGSTEANMPLYSPYDAPRVGSCGKPYGGFDVDIVDDDDRPLPPGQAGELVVRPRYPWTVSLGYHGMADRSQEVWRNLWLHTGDRLTRDEDGYFYFVDRVRDAIRRRGENISSYEVERTVAAYPDVAECAVVGVPAELGEEEVLAVVVPRSGTDLSPADLVAYCEGRMARFMVPRFVEIVAELPKTPNGKVEKHRLRERGVTSATWDRDRARSDAAGERREIRA